MNEELRQNILEGIEWAKAWIEKSCKEDDRQQLHDAWEANRLAEECLRTNGFFH